VSPTVSVVMAVRNGERYLAEAIDSVLAEPVDQLVVVDDGSTDTTCSILSSYGDRIDVLRQPPSGQAAALNEGLRCATGTILGFQDADDLWVPDRQGRLLDALRDGVDLVIGAVQQFASPDLDPAAVARLRIDVRARTAPLLPCMLVRRAAFDLVGAFDPELQSAHNIDWTSRARSVPLRVATIGDVVLQRRIHEGNHGRLRSTENRHDLTRVMRAHLDRRSRP
jgi:glycosyltransferase involved in cell wall biosynthesis